VTPSVLVFVVEDEDTILNVLEEALSDGGFDVAVARSGDEAMAMLEEDGTGYSALITDIKFPPDSIPDGTSPVVPARSMTSCLSSTSRATAAMNGPPKVCPIANLSRSLLPSLRWSRRFRTSSTQPPLTEDAQWRGGS